MPNTLVYPSVQKNAPDAPAATSHALVPPSGKSLKSISSAFCNIELGPLVDFSELGGSVVSQKFEGAEASILSPDVGRIYWSNSNHEQIKMTL